MNSTEIHNSFKEMRHNLQEAQHQVRLSLPVVAANIRNATENDLSWPTHDALSKLKRILRKWDMNKQQWK